MTEVLEVDAAATGDTATPIDERTHRRQSRSVASEQLVVVGGQLAAGLGNLVFAVAAAHILDHAAFTALATFLVAYLLLHLPSAAFGAGTALDPALARTVRRRALVAAGAVAAILVVTAPVVASALRQPVALPLILAAATPTAALLALERGRLYGTGAHRPLVKSLVAEPVLRLGAGLALAGAFGVTGAALGVVVAGYAALAVAIRGRSSIATRGAQTVRPHAVVAAFLLLALLQNEDLLVATRVLPSGEAARFAALSTLGGLAAFATATIPMVLLPRRGSRRAVLVALFVAGALGAGATFGVLLASGPIVTVAFGSSYSSIAPLAAPYVLAMALLGVLRVLVADAATGPRPRAMLAVLAGAVALHVAIILAFGTTAGSVAVATLATTTVGVVAVGTLTLTRPRRVVGLTGARIRAWTIRALPVTAITGLALALRLAVTRGIWVDEAISISGAKAPFGEMLRQLQTTDVQPPLHSALLWVTIRVAGSSELAIRSPSIIAGTLVVPMLFFLGRELYDHRTGIVAALVGAVFPIAIWYSQEGRMYSLYMLFAVVAVYGQVRALRDGRARWWVLYAVTTAALLWTQYLSLLFVAAQQVVFIAALRRARRNGDPIRRTLAAWLGSLVLVAVLLAPLVPYLLHQLAAYADRGAGFGSVPAQAGNALTRQPGVSVYSIIANLLWAVGGYHADRTMELLAALWPLGMVGALALLGRRVARETQLLVLLVVLPVSVLFLVGLRRPDLFELRYVAAVVPVLALLLARATTALTVRPAATRIVAGCVVAVLLVSLADQQLNGANPRLYDFRGAVHEIAAKAGPHDTVLYNPVYLESVVHYYGPHLHVRPIDDWRAALATRGRIFVIGSFLDKRAVSGRTGAVLARLEAKRTVVDTFRVPQIRVWVLR